MFSRTLFLALAAAAMFLGGGGAALAIGKPHLVSTCIHDAAMDYELINNPTYVVELNRIIDSFRDARKVVFIECEAVEGLFAFRDDSDASMPHNNFIVYAPAFVRLATQENPVKLQFLLAHEYAHISLGHFTDQKNLSTYTKELQADARAGCAVARLNGDLGSLIQILSGLRDDSGGSGYPSRADSEKAVREAYQECVATHLGGADYSAPSRSRVALIQPASTTIESVGRSIDWLTSGSWDSDLANIRSLKTAVTPQTPVSISIAEIARLWNGDESLFLVMRDNSDDSNANAPGARPSAPTFAGLFYLGPYGAKGRSVVVSMGLADRFTADVADPAHQNLLLIDKISAVALGYAALKYAVETDQPKEVLRRFATMTRFALTDLRDHGGEVSDFKQWTASLSHVDELLEAIGS